jgi:hypothetical protein
MGGATLCKATPTEIYLSGVYYGATNLNVVFALSSIFTADVTKSRRCLKQVLKVVFAIYVVEY